MVDFSAENAIVTDCDPSELSYFLTPEENELVLEPFHPIDSLYIIKSVKDTAPVIEHIFGAKNAR